MAGVYSTIDKTKYVQCIEPKAISATTAGAAVDTNGYNSVGFIVNVGTVSTADSDNYFVLTFHHCDKSDKSDAADAANFIEAKQGTLTGLKINATTAGKVMYTFNYSGNKRYVYATWTETGTAVMDGGVTVALSVGKNPVS